MATPGRPIDLGGHHATVGPRNHPWVAPDRGGLVFTASPAAACGFYYNVDEIPAGAAYTAYYVDEGWEYWDALGPFWVYVVDPPPGRYCGA